MKDEEFGIDDDFWVDSVEFRRSPQAETTLRLMRVDDLIFAGGEF